jgi:signal transduction histidine kinase
VQRGRAEAALELTQAELERAARFAADASHQLKTPVSVFRASLDELLARDDLTAPVREEISTLVSRTYRFTGMIEDLLLLSRMEAGQLQIEFASVSLTHLVESWLDDLSVLPNPMALDVSADVPADLRVAGETRYVSIILQNLLENARKYNRPGGKIKIAARADATSVRLTIGNHGHAIPVETQPHIFNRFHRGAAGENIPGHGLGLNLARELARLHGGDVRLARSADDWTEFEVSFRLAIAARISVLETT